MQGHPFIIIYSSSLEHKQYHNIVIGKEKYISILQQVRRDILLIYSLICEQNTTPTAGAALSTVKVGERGRSTKGFGLARDV